MAHQRSLSNASDCGPRLSHANPLRDAQRAMVLTFTCCHRRSVIAFLCPTVYHCGMLRMGSQTSVLNLKFGSPSMAHPLAIKSDNPAVHQSTASRVYKWKINVPYPAADVPRLIRFALVCDDRFKPIRNAFIAAEIQSVRLTNAMPCLQRAAQPTSPCISVHAMPHLSSTHSASQFHACQYPVDVNWDCLLLFVAAV